MRLILLKEHDITILLKIHAIRDYHIIFSVIVTYKKNELLSLICFITLLMALPLVGAVVSCQL